MEKNDPPPGVAPPPGYAPPTAAPGVTTTYPSTSMTIQQPILRVFGPNPQIIICPSCNHQITTNVRPEASTKTHIMAAVLCLVWCCCVPYFVDSCKNQNHYCPNCNAFLGAYIN